MSIPKDRLLAIRNGAKGPQRDGGSEKRAIATELLACRAELGAERERFNLLSQRCDAAERDRDAARAEAEKLRGIKPTIRHGDGSKGTRFGIRWNGPQSPLAVPMDDGYWTPWHVAQAELAAVKRQRDGMVAIAADLRERVRGVRILYDTCKSTEPLRVAIDCYEEVAKRIEALAAEQPKPQQPEHDPWRLDYGGPTKPQQTEVQP